MENNNKISLWSMGMNERFGIGLGTGKGLVGVWVSTPYGLVCMDVSPYSMYWSMKVSYEWGRAEGGE